MGTHEIRAWRPAVPGVAEVLHARFTEHAYPLHTHDTWTVLIVDAGAVAYDLDREAHGALRDSVTLLPPHVPHNGRAATAGGFRKRVVYLEADQLDESLAGRAVDGPTLADAELRREIVRAHRTLWRSGDELEAESRLAVVRERLEYHLRSMDAPVRGDTAMARRLRALLDERMESGMSLAAASRVLGPHPAQLVRVFAHAYGMPPHRYLNARRLDNARRLLLAGEPAASVAARVGYFDQSHLTRHFRRLLGVTPAAYARAAGPRPA